MKLRVFVPATERPEEGDWRWILFDARHDVLREEASGPSGMPRAGDVELVLPASRVLFARLKLPRVGSSTLRELLPYAVEDRLLADPSRIHAVAGPGDTRGETLVAVIDREWLRASVETLRAEGLQAGRAWCESVLATSDSAGWHLVLGRSRGFVVDALGAAQAFDRAGGGAEVPLALRIALDEASARGERPASVRIHAEEGVTLPDLERWSAEAGIGFERGAGWEALAHSRAASGAMDLLAPDLASSSQRASRFSVPRAAWILAGIIVVLQLGLEGAQTRRLAAERSALQSRAEAIFRSAFPEARAVVDPALQMQRNLAELRRTRGLGGGDDFLVQLSRAARDSKGPVRSVEYADGKLDVRTGAATVAEARP